MKKNNLERQVQMIKTRILNDTNLVVTQASNRITFTKSEKNGDKTTGFSKLFLVIDGLPIIQKNDTPSEKIISLTKWLFRKDSATYFGASVPLRNRL